MKCLFGVATIFALVVGCESPIPLLPTHEEEFASFCGKMEGVVDFLRVDLAGAFEEKYCLDQQGRRHGRYQLRRDKRYEWGIVLSGRYEADVPVGNWTDNRHALKGEGVVLPHHLSFVEGACSQDPAEIARKVNTFPPDNAGGN